MSIQELFYQEVQEALTSSDRLPQEKTFSSEEIDRLPEILRKFMVASGYLGKTRHTNVYLTYEHAAIRLKPGGNWMRLDCRQFNSVSPPTRIALMQSRLFGLLPFGAKDAYQHGRGNMLIKLAGFTLSDAQGWQMNQAALVTFLAEAILLPTALLQPNIAFEKVGPNQVRASITDAGMRVSGDFTTNSRHQITAFTTNDRFYSKNGREYENWRWSALLDRYSIRNGVATPTVVRAVWHMPNGQDYEYFRAAIKAFHYNWQGPEKRQG